MLQSIFLYVLYVVGEKSKVGRGLPLSPWLFHVQCSSVAAKANELLGIIHQSFVNTIILRYFVYIYKSLVRLIVASSGALIISWTNKLLKKSSIE